MRQIRDATRQDRRLFLSLWHDYLKELRDLGSEVLPTDRTLTFYAGLFDGYVGGVLHGVVLFSVRGPATPDDVGVLMWGEVPSTGAHPETEFGRIAQGWGTYIAPAARGEGLSSSLRREAKRRLREMGFDSVIGGAHTMNDRGLDTGVGAGFRIYQKLGVLDLRKEA